jgi:hypothetical protein
MDAPRQSVRNVSPESERYAQEYVNQDFSFVVGERNAANRRKLFSGKVFLNVAASVTFSGGARASHFGISP